MGIVCSGSGCVVAWRAAPGALLLFDVKGELDREETGVFPRLMSLNADGAVGCGSVSVRTTKASTTAMALL